MSALFRATEISSGVSINKAASSKYKLHPQRANGYPSLRACTQTLHWHKGLGVQTQPPEPVTINFIFQTLENNLSVVQGASTAVSYHIKQADCIKAHYPIQQLSYNKLIHQGKPFAPRSFSSFETVSKTHSHTRINLLIHTYKFPDAEKRQLFPAVCKTLGNHPKSGF